MKVSWLQWLFRKQLRISKVFYNGRYQIVKRDSKGRFCK